MKTTSPVAKVTQISVPTKYSVDVSVRTAVKEPKRSTSMPEMTVLPIPASVPAVLEMPAQAKSCETALCCSSIREPLNQN